MNLEARSSNTSDTHFNHFVGCGRCKLIIEEPLFNLIRLDAYLEGEYSNIKFADMEFDNPESHVIRNAPECANFMGLPFTVYYKNGKMVHATSSIQSMEQVREVLNSKFSVAVEG